MTPIQRPQPARLPIGMRSIVGAAAASLLAASPAAAASTLELFPDIPLVVVLVLLFAALIIPVNNLIFKPMFRVLDEREERIAGARRRAESLDKQAQEVFGRYSTAVREARDEAEGGRREQLEAARNEQQQVATDARAQAERELESSRADLAAQVESARGELRTTAESLANDMANRVLGSSH